MLMIIPINITISICHPSAFQAVYRGYCLARWELLFSLIHTWLGIHRRWILLPWCTILSETWSGIFQWWFF